ncbi:putative peroxisomal-coenzyme A synthetase [Cyphellophora attinorum]|uniref:Putative peroxisomal-coenzyme A synthetase n=1 Tax=Cyphellophora attinorum TaxID=1664694 RepID=A0A0N1HMZ7_9EURO|nr:putative peroxisomal-coenzyme A synthetase [Phialophora attinorum]KPI36260.1 putative peroxisomal-coenzyme A synthetase [Phialophora attinorum]
MSTLTTDALLASHYPGIIIPRDEDSISFSHIQIIRLVNKFQRSLLNIDIRSDDTIAIVLPPSMEFLVSLLAATSGSVTVAPLDPEYSQADFETVFKEIRPSAVLLAAGSLREHTPAVAAALACRVPIAEVSFDLKSVTVCEFIRLGRRRSTDASVSFSKPNRNDTAILLHHSRASGRELRCARFSHSQSISICQRIEAAHNFGPADRGMLITPVHQAHGLFLGLLGPLLAGSSVIIPKAFSAQTFWTDCMFDYATWYTAEACTQQEIEKLPYPQLLSSVRVVSSDRLAEIMEECLQETEPDDQEDEEAVEKDSLALQCEAGTTLQCIGRRSCMKGSSTRSSGKKVRFATLADEIQSRVITSPGVPDIRSMLQSWFAVQALTHLTQVYSSFQRVQV